MTSHHLLPWIAVGCCLAAPALAQIQSSKLVASDTEPEDQFGTSVAISGDWLIVGAPFEDDVEIQSGSAYLYHREATGWVEIQKLKATPTSFGQILGAAVAIDGDVAAVGAPGDSQITADGGAVYVFERQGRVWIQTACLSASDWSTSSQRQFGHSVSVFGERILVGAIGDDSPVDSGAAYVFVDQGGTWVEEAKLEAGDPQSFARFGYSVSLEDGRALVGAPYKGSGSLNSSGAAYVFESSEGPWLQMQKLTADDAWHNDRFGFSVSLSGTTALVGAPEHAHLPDHAGGAAYIFERGQTDWSQTAELRGSDSALGDIFGLSVTLENDLAVIGAGSHDDLGEGFGNGTGASYAFRRINAVWLQISKLISEDGSANDYLGKSLDLDGSTTLVGASQDDPGCTNNCRSGSAYTLELALDAVQYCSCPGVAPCGNTDAHGGCTNSTGFGAVLAASGSASVTSDELTMRVDHLRPFGTGLIFMGGGSASVPFGNGIRCIGPGPSGLFRFGAQTISENGTLLQGPGMVAQSASFPPSGLITAGSTWYFQCWYRDALGPCGGTSNFSNALAIAFQP